MPLLYSSAIYLLTYLMPVQLNGVIGTQIAAATAIYFLRGKCMSVYTIPTQILWQLLGQIMAFSCYLFHLIYE